MVRKSQLWCHMHLRWPHVRSQHQCYELMTELLCCGRAYIFHECFACLLATIRKVLPFQCILIEVLTINSHYELLKMDILEQLFITVCISDEATSSLLSSLHCFGTVGLSWVTRTQWRFKTEIVHKHQLELGAVLSPAPLSDSML